MKAAVLHRFGKAPRYEAFPDPVLEQDEILLHVQAVALENVDRALARGTHYATSHLLPKLPAILGADGIGALADGHLVGFGGIRSPYGALAEFVPVRNHYSIPIPDGVDAATAAAVPSSAMTALFALRWGARLQPEETVLVQGGTGFAGRLAIQVAKLLGAPRVVATGRDGAALRALPDLGADAVIDLTQSDKQIAAALAREAGAGSGAAGYGVILDYLWGRPTEQLIASLVPRDLTPARHRVRLVQIGETAGPRIALPAEALRTSGLEIIGAGAGITPEAFGEGSSQVWDWIKQGNLRAEIERMPLSEIERAWKRTDPHGKRIVITL